MGHEDSHVQATLSVQISGTKRWRLMPLRRRKAPFLAMPLGKFESNVLGIRASLRGCGVSKNRGTPKSSILIGFSIMNHILDIYVRFQGGI